MINLFFLMITLLNDFIKYFRSYEVFDFYNPPFTFM